MKRAWVVVVLALLPACRRKITVHVSRGQRPPLPTDVVGPLSSGTRVERAKAVRDLLAGGSAKELPIRVTDPGRSWDKELYRSLVHLWPATVASAHARLVKPGERAAELSPWLKRQEPLLARCLIHPRKDKLLGLGYIGTSGKKKPPEPRTISDKAMLDLTLLPGGRVGAIRHESVSAAYKCPMLTLQALRHPLKLDKPLVVRVELSLKWTSPD